MKFRKKKNKRRKEERIRKGREYTGHGIVLVSDAQEKQISSPLFSTQRRPFDYQSARDKETPATIWAKNQSARLDLVKFSLRTKESGAAVIGLCAPEYGLVWPFDCPNFAQWTKENCKLSSQGKKWGK